MIYLRLSSSPLFFFSHTPKTGLLAAATKDEKKWAFGWLMVLLLAPTDLLQFNKSFSTALRHEKSLLFFLSLGPALFRLTRWTSLTFQWTEKRKKNWQESWRKRRIFLGGKFLYSRWCSHMLHVHATIWCRLNFPHEIASYFHQKVLGAVICCERERVERDLWTRADWILLFSP